MICATEMSIYLKYGGRRGGPESRGDLLMKDRGHIKVGLVGFFKIFLLLTLADIDTVTDTEVVSV